MPIVLDLARKKKLMDYQKEIKIHFRLGVYILRHTKILESALTPPVLRPLVGGGIGVFAFYDVPSARIQWNSDPFSAWGASVSGVG